MPPAYVAQLALYRAVLARLYPGKAMRAALIFTAVPVLIEIPAASSDAKLREILTNRQLSDRHAPVRVP